MKKFTARYAILVCNKAMSKKNTYLSPTAERKAEKEIDAFLQRINTPSAPSMLDELRKIAGSPERA